VDHLVTASIGIAWAGRSSSGHPDGITADEMLQNADAAMYRAKDRGKDCYELLDYGPISRSPVDLVG
jgi:GGDEF domain-containing protein